MRRNGISARAFMATLSTAGRLTEPTVKPAEVKPGCTLCAQIAAEGGFGPRHDGSRFCESGSIAAGGKNEHCSCDRCF